MSGSPRTAAAIAALGTLTLVVLFFVLSGMQDDGGEEPEGTVETTQPADAAPQSEPVGPAIVIRNGKPRGGPAEIEAQSGGVIRFTVESDAADELHLHGYDEYIDVPAGKAKRVEVDARLEGVFELESHSTGALFAEITVTP